jgi:uncharacterized protein (DUF1778 family)
MGKKRGRPPTEAGKAKAQTVEVRVTDAEKQAFQTAAHLSGLSLSSWVRERLRRIATTELREAGRPIAFLDRAGVPNTTSAKTKT